MTARALVSRAPLVAFQVALGVALVAKGLVSSGVGTRSLQVRGDVLLDLLDQQLPPFDIGNVRR